MVIEKEQLMENQLVPLWVILKVLLKVYHWDFELDCLMDMTKEMMMEPLLCFTFPTHKI